MSIKEKILRMAAYYDAETIANSLRVPIETVEDILDGKAEITVQTEQFAQAQVLQVNTSRTAHRQKVIVVCRGKGGVGATAVAMHLGRQISERVSTLLIDLNIDNGGSDLTYYLNLPSYPHLGIAKNNLLEGIIQYQKDLNIIAPPMSKKELGGFTAEDVQKLIFQARQEFDAIIIDLPNRLDDITKEALSCANTLVMIMGAFRQEIFRLAHLSESYVTKDKYLVINNCALDANTAVEILQAHKSVVIPYDDELENSFENQQFLSKKSGFSMGVESLKELIYEEIPKKGGLKGWLTRW
ncbi:conserved hypothetical protein [Desulforamulus reducens MI-1]|uniref:AAA domain-containing protein n=1 Tax=Desulforamulus reducens (strain ATCC BAA-1160 / DSM 100696 / MI-1) TaxID=349161 RepID=A4J334_DESRM|nr:AAA family ATPase [Desulforamulus reducens]ABO49487.1 conserved hypothetical protein [Desulforamulus reducens MI-1]